MAHPRAVAVRRQIADQRLERAARAASDTFGVPFRTGPTLATRYPALAAAETTEHVAEFLENIVKAAQTPPAATRKRVSA